MSWAFFAITVRSLETYYLQISPSQTRAERTPSGRPFLPPEPSHPFVCPKPRKKKFLRSSYFFIHLHPTTDEFKGEWSKHQRSDTPNLLLLGGKRRSSRDHIEDDPLRKTKREGLDNETELVIAVHRAVHETTETERHDVEGFSKAG